MALPLSPLTPLTAPVSVKPPASVTFQIAVRDPNAPPAGVSRGVTLMISSDNNVFFQGKTKSHTHTQVILPIRTSVSITLGIIEDPPGGRALAGFNVSAFDDTGKRLGSVVIGLL